MRSYNSDAYDYHPRGCGYVKVCSAIEGELDGRDDVSMPLAPESFADSRSKARRMADLRLEQRVSALRSFFSALGIEVGMVEEYVGGMKDLAIRKNAERLRAVRHGGVVLRDIFGRRIGSGRLEDVGVTAGELDSIVSLNSRYR